VAWPAPFLKSRAGWAPLPEGGGLQPAALLDRQQAFDVFAVTVAAEALAVALAVVAVQTDAVGRAVVLVQDQAPPAHLGRDRLQVVGIDLFGLIALLLAQHQGIAAAGGLR